MQLGLVDLADMIYSRSEYSVQKRARTSIGEPSTVGESGSDHQPLGDPVLFGLNEGKIALANRRKDPLFLFSAMQRHLGYPPVPRLQPADPLPAIVPQLQRRMENLESRIKLLEEEQRGGIDITKYYGHGSIPKPPE